MAMLQLRLNWVLSRPANVSFHSHNTKAFKSMNLRMDQMPKNTSILIISGAIRISAIERLSVISVECDSMCRHLKETVVKIDSAIHMRGVQNALLCPPPSTPWNKGLVPAEACRIPHSRIFEVLVLWRFNIGTNYTLCTCIFFLINSIGSQRQLHKQYII